jgi:hypothetical protein
MQNLSKQRPKRTVSEIDLVVANTAFSPKPFLSEK